MEEIQLMIKIPEDSYKAACNGCMLPPDVKNIIQGIKNSTSLTVDMLADMLMEERIRGELKHDISYSKDVIDNVRCRLTVDIIDRRPCFCGAELREVWRESDET